MDSGDVVRRGDRFGVSRAGFLSAVAGLILVCQLVGWSTISPLLLARQHIEPSRSTEVFHNQKFRGNAVVVPRIHARGTAVLSPKLEDFKDLMKDPVILQRLRSQQTPQENELLARDSDDHAAWIKETILRPRQPVLDRLERAGVHLRDERLIELLPTWKQVTSLYGSDPIIYGTETCKTFRNRVSSDQRYVGISGQMNTGTNALSQLFRNNLRIADNPNQDGVLWTVPWYKHAWLSLRYNYMYRLPDEHNTVLPVIIIRDPYFWMQSMCQSPYTLYWKMSKSHCPNLIEDETLFEADGNGHTRNIPEDLGVEIKIRWGNYLRTWPSLMHVWSSWYGEYYQQADFPRLIVRFEDLVFHTEHVMNAIRECVGAQWKEDQFIYSTQPAKQGNYYDQYKIQGGYVSAMIRYGQDLGQRSFNMTREDLEYAERFLNITLMEQFHYSMKLE